MLRAQTTEIKTQRDKPKNIGVGWVSLERVPIECGQIFFTFFGFNNSNRLMWDLKL